MNFLKNSLFGSRLRIVTFVVLPIFIILLILIWIYMLFSNSQSSTISEVNNAVQVENSSLSELNIITTSQTNSSKVTGTKASFQDLDKPQNTNNSSQSSIITLTSPVASTPEIDSIEITKLLDKVESLNNNNDDIILDNQILEN